MKKIFWIPVLITILAAFFASAFPDGLDFTAKKLGFGKLAIERSAPMAGYSIPFIAHAKLSTSIAGVFGVLITAGIFFLAAYGFACYNSIKGKPDGRLEKSGRKVRAAQDIGGSR